jgi:hypothetical protein
LPGCKAVRGSLWVKTLGEGQFGEAACLEAVDSSDLVLTIAAAEADTMAVVTELADLGGETELVLQLVARERLSRDGA